MRIHSWQPRFGCKIDDAGAVIIGPASPHYHERICILARSSEGILQFARFFQLQTLKLNPQGTGRSLHFPEVSRARQTGPYMGNTIDFGE